MDNKLGNKRTQQITTKKLQQYKLQADIIAWGRRNPVKFIKYFFGIELLDAQAYIITLAWNAKYVMFVGSRNIGKSFIFGLYIMARNLLFPNYQTYIMSGTASQSNETFSKIEKIVKNEINSIKSGTDVYANELVKSTANRDGFLHNPASYQYRLYNGSAVNSLNSDEDNNRGKRSNLNFYDESGFMTENYINVTTKFLSQNEGFSTGGDVPTELEPINFPNQQIFASSASSTDSEFYKIYRLWSKKMIMGDPDYVVFDLDCSVPLHPTLKGKPFTPLLSQSQIDNDLKQNKEKALREYYNQFSNDGGDQQMLKRAEIIKNSKPMLPIMANPDGKQLFGFAYDPARNQDNSIVLVGRFYFDDKVGWRLDIVNGVSFVDIAKKNKTPMMTPNQIDILKQMMLDYNGRGVPDYQNIKYVGIDSGAGGAGRTIADYLMDDWVAQDRSKHKGIIDKVENADYISKFPNAMDIMKLLSPLKYKKEMFDSLVELVRLGLINFPQEYDGKGYITMFKKVKNKNYNENKPISDENCPYFNEPYQVQLSFDEELALINIDLMKEELVHMQRYDGTNGNYRYDLSADVKNKMHDDRAYCCAILAFELQLLRKGCLRNSNETETIDVNDYLNKLISVVNY